MSKPRCIPGRSLTRLVRQFHDRLVVRHVLSSGELLPPHHHRTRHVVLPPVRVSGEDLGGRRFPPTCGNPGDMNRLGVSTLRVVDVQRDEDEDEEIEGTLIVEVAEVWP